MKLTITLGKINLHMDPHVALVPQLESALLSVDDDIRRLTRKRKTLEAALANLEDSKPTRAKATPRIHAVAS